MTTPEQLAKWREEAYLALNNEPDNWGIDGGGYEIGYLRAKQECEQVLKLAKFGAMVIRNQYLDDKEQFISQLQSCGVADMHWNIPLEMRTVILELLK